MKKLLSLATMFALAMSMTALQAQEQPKGSAKKSKTECGSQAKKSGCCGPGAKKTSKAKASDEKAKEDKSDKVGQSEARN